MGWRSWNFFQCNINQQIMEAQMDALVAPRHGTSLLKLGYENVGLVRTDAGLHRPCYTGSYRPATLP